MIKLSIFLTLLANCVVCLLLLNALTIVYVLFFLPPSTNWEGGPINIIVGFYFIGIIDWFVWDQHCQPKCDRIHRAIWMALRHPIIFFTDQYLYMTMLLEEGNNEVNSHHQQNVTNNTEARRQQIAKECMLFDQQSQTLWAFYLYNRIDK